jgi:hypothetical protein
MTPYSCHSISEEDEEIIETSSVRENEFYVCRNFHDHCSLTAIVFGSLV